MNKILVIYAMSAVLSLGIWGYNFKKITDCDFESNYKCELIHGFGVVVPPASFVTVWFDTDTDTDTEQK